ncbi:MAG: FxLYD domain-containing protein [Candidatus Bathyarchaeota archaeon]|nr:FxLYD domain-containing protein [Candidatus Bathyarchaeota archaeon]
MLKKIVSGMVLALLLIGMSTLVFNIQPAYAAAQVNILTHSGWLDSIGHYHVSGEVENVGDGAASFVKITATFYDSSDTVIATSFTYTRLSVLLPARKSPFEVLLIDTTQATKVHHYSLSVKFSATSPIPIGLEILSNSSYIDAVGCMHVVGEIKNIATGNATYVKVIATFYNSTGHVVATDFTYSDPSDISPGQKAPFDVLLIHKNRAPLVATYALTAESNQYAVVSEFPSILIQSLFMFLTFFAIFIIKM